MHIDKSKNDLTASCSKPDYDTATITQSAHFGAATFGNIIAGGVAGVIVDAASGANYTYPATMQIALSPSVPAPVANAGQPIVLPTGYTVPTPGS